MNELIVINVLSKWHLYCAEALIESRGYLNKGVDCVVFALFHEPSGSFRVTQNDLSIINNLTNVYFFQIKRADEQNEKINTVLSSNYPYNRMLMISPRELNLRQVMATRKISNREYVIVDEGLGSYYTKRLWDLEGKALGRKVSFKTKVKNGCEQIMRCNATKWNILRKKGDEWIVNYDVTEALSRYFMMQEKSNIVDAEGVKDGIDIYISDNLSIMSKSNEYELDFYSKVYNYIRERNNDVGKNIYFKPHPNELRRNELIDELKHIGFQILNTRTSTEDLCNRYSMTVYGLCSTSLVTAGLLFGQNVMTLIGLLDRSCLNEYGSLRTSEFLDITQNITEIKR